MKPVWRPIFLQAGVVVVHRSVALFIATEVVLLLWIRDSLVLNIIMLLAPIDALKTWQLGG